MILTIDNDLYTTLNAVVPTYNTIGEKTDSVYCVFQSDITPFRTKDGIYKYDATIRIVIVATNYDTGYAKYTAAIEALEALNSDKYRVLIGAYSKEQDEDSKVWAFINDLKIIQYK